MEQIIYPAKQLQTLKEFYDMRVEDIVKQTGASTTTINNALQGKSSVDLRKFVAIADALNADVIITLKARDPRFHEHVKTLLPDASASE